MLYCYLKPQNSISIHVHLDCAAGAVNPSKHIQEWAGLRATSNLFHAATWPRSPCQWSEEWRRLGLAKFKDSLAQGMGW